MGVNIVEALVPRIYNDHADCLSRLELASDYWINKVLLFSLQNKWGIHPDVNLFSTSTTSFCKSFCAIRNVRGREGFRKCHVFQLVGYDANITPPISLINRVLEKFSREGELGVLILPNWSG
jgi:hypothetical protein